VTSIRDDNDCVIPFLVADLFIHGSDNALMAPRVCLLICRSGYLT
jgi:hypothetical protein